MARPDQGDLAPGLLILLFDCICRKYLKFSSEVGRGSFDHLPDTSQDLSSTYHILEKTRMLDFATSCYCLTIILYDTYYD
jgi:hypothetical protein